MVRSTTRRRIRTAFTVLFFLVFADGLAAFGCFMVIRNGAARRPAGEQIAPIRDHGTTYYVTATEARVYRVLLIGMIAGVPFVIITAFISDLVFHFPLLGKDSRSDE